MNDPTKPGELHKSWLNLKSRESVRQSQSRATKAHYALKKIGPVTLGWKGK
jgi:hypothetical protein